jgi:hypothetical protein
LVIPALKEFKEHRVLMEFKEQLAPTELLVAEHLELPVQTAHLGLLELQEQVQQVQTELLVLLVQTELQVLLVQQAQVLPELSD